MTSNASRPGPISPGNVVSAALRIYRDQFRTYFGLSAKAILWLIIPLIGCGIIAAIAIPLALARGVSSSSILLIILFLGLLLVPISYGGAKYAMHTGLMARMAYQTLINQPETARQAHKQVNPKMWSFLWIVALFILICLAAYVVLGIVSGIAGFIIAFALGSLLSSIFGEAGIIISGILTGVIAFGIFFIGLLQIASRLFIAEVPLAIESNLGAGGSIGRSWQLTQKSIGRIQLIVLATYLVTLPIMLVTNILPQLILLRMDPTSPGYLILNLILVVLSVAVSIAVLPFWQATKGVLYYDLRSRREGADLKI
ncbi:MAG: hypothetical protein AB8B99_06710 [Phormidesmis sp.]